MLSVSATPGIPHPYAVTYILLTIFSITQQLLIGLSTCTYIFVSPIKSTIHINASSPRGMKAVCSRNEKNRI